MNRRRGWAVVVLGAVLLASACGGGDDETSPEGSDGLRIASFDFAESEVVSEVYAQAVESAGIPVIRLGPIGPREVVAPAMQDDLADLVIEYAGSVLGYAGFPDASRSIEETVDLMRTHMEPLGLVILEPAPALDTNVFVVSRDNAAALGLDEVSDLVDAGFTRLGGPAECPDRALCMLGLADVYGVTFDEFVPQPTLAFTAESLRRGEIDVGVLFSTAPEAEADDLVVLADDRRLQPADNLVPVLRRDAVERWGSELTDTLDAVSAVLTTADVRDMNRRIAEGESVVDVAADWLLASDLPM